MEKDLDRLAEDLLGMVDAAPSGKELLREVFYLGKMLMEKNIAYGNSALDPVRVFSKAPLDEQIRVRLDDKLSRLQRGTEAGEDVELDLVGYIVLLRVARSRNRSSR